MPAVVMTQELENQIRSIFASAETLNRLYVLDMILAR